MRNLWHTLAPFATDTSGACSVFSCAHALVIAQDSNGTVSTLRRVIDINAGDAAYATIDLPEISYTLGREVDFQDRMGQILAADNAYCEAAGIPVADLVVLVGGPVSNLLGTDLASRAREFEQRCKVRSIAVQTGGNEYYDKGIARAYAVIYQSFSLNPATRPTEREKDAVNLLGLNTLDFTSNQLVRALEEGLGRHDLGVVSDWGFSDAQDSWGVALAAGSSIVCSVSGLSLARRMEAEEGVPYTTIDKLDWFDRLIPGSFAGSPRIVVIGEQLTSNLLRRLLLRMGAKQVDVATFFTLDRTCKEPRDHKLKGESDVQELLSGDAYDLAIGDRIFEPLSQVRYAPLMHPPAGFGARDGAVLGRSWLEWLTRMF